MSAKPSVAIETPSATTHRAPIFVSAMQASTVMGSAARLIQVGMRERERTRAREGKGKIQSAGQIRNKSRIMVPGRKV